MTIENFWVPPFCTFPCLCWAWSLCTTSLSTYSNQTEDRKKQKEDLKHFLSLFDQGYKFSVDSNSLEYMQSMGNIHSVRGGIHTQWGKMHWMGGLYAINGGICTENGEVVHLMGMGELHRMGVLTLYFLGPIFCSLWKMN